MTRPKFHEDPILPVHAYLDGEPLSILRANHAVRGVVVPAGSHSVRFRYEPASFALGLKLAGLSAVILLAWLGINLWHARQPGMPQVQPSALEREACA